MQHATINQKTAMYKYRKSFHTRDLMIIISLLLLISTELQMTNISDS